MIRRAAFALPIVLLLAFLLGALAGPVRAPNWMPTADEVACDSDGVTASYGTDYSTAPATYRVRTVTVGDIAPECQGGTIEVSLRSDSGSLGNGGPASVTGSTSRLTIDTPPRAEDVTNIHVSIATEADSGGEDGGGTGGGGPTIPSPIVTPTPAPSVTPTAPPISCRVAVQAGSLPPGMLVGTALDDTLIGTNAPESACAFPGDDLVNGMAGNDRLSGGKGEDSLRGGWGDDHILGWEDNDKIWGARGSDHVAGGSGEDRIKGDAGDDHMHGRYGDDHLWGGKGADTMIGGRGSDVVKGGPGRDLLRGSVGVDRLRGGAGFDVCYVQPSDTHQGCEEVRKR